MSDRPPGDAASGTVYRFGVYELDPAAGELRRRGVAVPLPPQPYRLLRLLVERSGELVRREELRSVLWEEGLHVDHEQGIAFAVRQVRQTLGDDARKAVFVETVRGRGYRFVAPVERLGAEPAAPLRERSQAPPSGPVARFLRRPVPVAVAFAAGVLFGALVSPLDGWVDRPGERSAETAAPAAPSVIILPLDELAPVENRSSLDSALGKEMADRLLCIDPGPRP